jgi:hypothetical protein
MVRQLLDRASRLLCLFAKAWQWDSIGSLLISTFSGDDFRFVHNGTIIVMTARGFSGEEKWDRPSEKCHGSENLRMYHE